MREKLIVVLLSVCCTLLVVNLIVLLNGETPAVHGQSGSGGGASSNDFIVATSATQNEPICFVFKADSQHLAAYMARTGGGIRVLGIRHTQWDFNQTEVLKHFSVAAAKKAK